MCEVREFSEAGSNSVITQKLQFDRMSKLKRNPLIDHALSSLPCRILKQALGVTCSKTQALLLLGEQLLTNFQVLVEESEILCASLFKFVQCIGGDRFTS